MQTTEQYHGGPPWDHGHLGSAAEARLRDLPAPHSQGQGHSPLYLHRFLKASLPPPPQQFFPSRLFIIGFYVGYLNARFRLNPYISFIFHLTSVFFDGLS